MYSDLLPFIRIKSQVEVLCGELDRLNDSVYRVGAGGWDETLREKVRWEIGEIIKLQIPQNNESKMIILRELKEEILNLPIVNLTIAIQPTEKMIEEISELLRREVDAGIVIDIQSNRLIVGGALITYQGKFGDFSIATKAEKVWTDNAEGLIKLAYGSNK